MHIKKSLKIPKGWSEFVNRRRTYNTKAKRKRTCWVNTNNQDIVTVQFQTFSFRHHNIDTLYVLNPVGLTEKVWNETREIKEKQLLSYYEHIYLHRQRSRWYTGNTIFCVLEFIVENIYLHTFYVNLSLKCRRVNWSDGVVAQISAKKCNDNSLLIVN
jgi:hypothetical protein